MPSPSRATMVAISRVVLLAGLLGAGGGALASDVRGRLSFGMTGILPDGADLALRFLSRVELEIGNAFGSRGSVSIDVEGRQSDIGLNTDAVGVRELTLRYGVVPQKFEVEAGRIDVSELEGLLVDGLGVRWQATRAVSMEIAGGVRTELETLYGKPDSDRTGFGVLLLAQGRRGSAQLGFSELRTGGATERRFVTGSAYGSLGNSLRGGGRFTFDFGQAGQSAHLTSLFVNGLYRFKRSFDVNVSYGTTSAFFSPELLDPNEFANLPEELRPALQSVPVYGPRLESFAIRGQVSPSRALSVYADARIDRREGEDGAPQSFALGGRLKLDRRDRSRLRAEVLRSDRPVYGLPPLATEMTRYWRWRAGMLHSFGRLLEVEALVSQTVRAETVEAAGDGFGGVGGELNATLLLGRRVSLLSYYSLEPGSGPRTHVFLTQLAYRF